MAVLVRARPYETYPGCLQYEGVTVQRLSSAPYAFGPYEVPEYTFWPIFFVIFH